MTYKHEMWRIGKAQRCGDSFHYHQHEESTHIHKNSISVPSLSLKHLVMHLWSGLALLVKESWRYSGDVLSVIRYMMLATASVLHTHQRNFSEVCQK